MPGEPPNLFSSLSFMLGGLISVACVCIHWPTSRSQPARGTPSMHGGQAKLMSAFADVQDLQETRVFRCG